MNRYVEPNWKRAKRRRNRKANKYSQQTLFPVAIADKIPAKKTTNQEATPRRRQNWQEAKTRINASRERAGWNEREKQRLVNYIQENKIMLPGDKKHLNFCPYTQQACLYPADKRQALVELTITKTTNQAQNEIQMEGAETTQTTSKNTYCCAIVAYKLGKQRTEQYNQTTHSRLTFNYEVTAKNENGRKDIDSLFGIAPCWRKG